MTKLMLRRIRVYGSDDDYSPDASGPLEPVVYEKKPTPVDRTTVYWGALPEIAAEAERIKVASENYALKHSLGLPVADEDPNEAIQAEMAALDPTILFASKPYRWWVTFVVEREQEMTTDPKLLARLESEMLASTDDFLNIAVTRMAITEGQGLYKNLLMDRVFFHLPERLAFANPKLKFSADASLSRPMKYFPREVTARLGEYAAAAEWLTSPCEWYLEAVKEKDVFKSFLWAFFAIESSVNKFADRLGAEAIKSDVELQERTRKVLIEAGVPAKEIDLTKLTPFLKLAVVAPSLGEASAVSRLKEFQAIKKFRGKLAHGTSVTENELAAYRDRAMEWLKAALADAFKVTEEPLNQPPAKPASE